MSKELADRLQSYVGRLSDLQGDHRSGKVNWLPPMTKTPHVFGDADYALEGDAKANYKLYADHAALLILASGAGNLDMIQWLVSNFSADAEGVRTAFLEASGAGWLKVAKLLQETYGSAVSLDYWPAFVRALVNNKAPAASWLSGFVTPTGSQLARLSHAVQRTGNKAALSWLEKRFPLP